MKNFDKKTVDTIVEYLSPFKNELINGNLYDWNGNLEKTIEKRKYLGGKLKDAQKKKISKEFYAVCEEIVKKWGGIKRITSENLKNAVNNFLNNEEKDFDRIASTSKVASFLDPIKYIICDSRVIYSINWILLDKCNTNKYFRMPSGQNKKLKTVNMEKLIRSKHNYENVNVRKANEILFIEKNKTYCIVNDLVKAVHNKLWKEEKLCEDKYHKLYYTEMILFAIAYEDIYKDIIKWVSEKKPHLLS